METLSEGTRIARAGKQGKYLGLLLLILTAFAGALGARWWHAHQFKPMDADDDGVAASALTAEIAHLAPAKRLPALLKALQDSDANIRAASIEPLMNLNSPEAIDAVESAFLDSASIVREAALEALPQMDKERGLRLELAAFRDDDLWIRESIAAHVTTAAHHTLLDRRAIPTLIRALDDSSPVVQTMAISALRHLTGHDWHVLSTASPEARQATMVQWKQWWASAAKSRPVPAEFNTIVARHSTRADRAPDFHLTDTTGKSVELSSERGKVILLNFWGTWCPPCQKEVPDLIRLHADYRGKGLDIVGIALSEDGGISGLRKHCAKKGILFRQTLANDAILDAYGHIHEVPVSVLIDTHGNIRNRWEGERDYGTFQAAVEQALRY